MSVKVIFCHGFAWWIACSLRGVVLKVKFFEEFLNMKSPSGFWNEGEGEDEFKDKEAGLGRAGVVKDVFKTISKTVSHPFL